MAPRIGVVIAARDEEKHIVRTLEALFSQTIRPVIIVVVDDGSIDNTGRVAARLGCRVIRINYRHPSWVGKPQLALVFNVGIEALPDDLDYMAIFGAETIPEKRYLEKVIRGMKRYELVIASGVIREEPDISRFPRGAGRVYDFRWWRKHIERFPPIYGWESYPVYKALSQGKRVGIVRNAYMTIGRRTRRMKPDYGYGMKMLGSTPVFVLARFLLNLIHGLREPQGIQNAFRMLAYYIRAPYKPYDPHVANTVKTAQLCTFLNKLYIIRQIKPGICDKYRILFVNA